MTPKEVLALIREKEVRAVDLRFMDFPGLWQHFTIPAEDAGRSTSSRRASASTAPASAAGRPSTSPTCSSCPAPRPPSSIPFCKDTTLTMICNIQDPLTARRLHPRPAQRRPQGRQLPEVHRHRRHRLFRPRSWSSSSSTTSATTRTQHSGYYYLDSVEGAWNTGRDEKPNLGYKLRYKEGYFPVPAGRRPARHPHRDDADHDRVRPRRSRPSTTRWPPAARARSTCSYAPLVEMADNVLKYKYIVKNVATKHGKTATFMPKPLFMDNGSRHARPHFAVEGRQEPLRRLRLRRAVARWPCTPSAACCSTPRPCAPSPTRRPTATSGWCPATRRRSTWPTAAATARPSIRIPVYSPQPQGQAHRVPLPGRLQQSVPGLRRHADGHARRHQEQDQPGRAAGQGHLRPGAGGTGQGAQDARLAGRGAGQPGEGPRVPAARRRVHRRRDQHLDLVQARKGSRRHAPAAASVRVRLYFDI